MSEEKRMLGNYEVTQSIYVGDKEVVLAVDKKEQCPLSDNFDHDFRGCNFYFW